MAPYATALAALVDPTAAAANFRRLDDRGRRRPLRLRRGARLHAAQDARRRTARPAPDPARVHGVRAWFAHHQGMSLVALANAGLGAAMVRRFHADPRVQATEPLLQERVPRFVPVIRPRPGEAHPQSSRCRSASRRGASARRTRSTRAPTSCRTATTPRSSPTPAAAASTWRGRAVTRQRDDPTCDPGSQFIYLRDVRSGLLWSAAYQPLCREPERYEVTFRADEALFVRRDDGIETRLEITVSPEDDVEVRRVSLINHCDVLREIEVTSLVEIVLAPPADDLSHPAFHKLFLETEYRPECTALLCGRRPRSPDEPTLWAVHVLSAESGVHGAIEWETDRMRFLGRGRTAENPVALDGRALSGTTGAVLDPVLSLRRRVRIAPGWQGAPGVRDRRRHRAARAAIALAEKYDDPDLGGAHLHARRRRRPRCGCATSASRPTRRSSTSGSPRACSGAIATLRADPSFLAANTLGQSGLWAHGISGDLPILIVRVVQDDNLALVRQVLRAQEYWRLKGLTADVVDPQRASRRATSTRCRSSSRACSRRARGPPGGSARAACSCCAAMACRRPRACCCWRRPARC